MDLLKLQSASIETLREFFFVSTIYDRKLQGIKPLINILWHLNHSGARQKVDRLYVSRCRDEKITKS